MNKIPLKIDVFEIYAPEGRVLVFDVPKRPFGTPIKYNGIYYARKADALSRLSEDRLRSIFAESGHDFSADICADANIEHLNEKAIEDFRLRWYRKSNNPTIKTLTREQLLQDAELLIDGKITFAALVLFGERKFLGRFLGQAEVVFEYRSSEASGPPQQREEYRQGFFSFYDDLWSVINRRNDLQHFQNGLFILDIPTFDERQIRELILNAISHRDYQLGGNVFIRQYPRRLVVESPGGLPVGITTENILDRQSPRNRRIADAFAKCGLVERSGQGMNLIFEQSIRQGKPLPDFTGTDQFNVAVSLIGQVRNSRFVQFLEQVGQETTASFSTHDFLVLDHIYREEKLPEYLLRRLSHLSELGVIEKQGSGRGIRYILSKRLYSTIGEKGVYTRKKGLDRETKKQLLLQHITENASEGSQMKEFLQIQLGTRPQVKALLKELKSEKKINLIGKTSAARWFPTKKN